MEKEWFERWFGAEYKALYRNRNDAQAQDQVNALVRSCSASPDWNILDVGCGSGRHLRSFHKNGFSHACGIDLSRVLLQDARSSGMPVAQADMRALPFPNAIFDLLGCFFTSFGYFATRDEDADVLAEFGRVVKPGGMIFLDLLNPEPALRSLVGHDTKTVDGDVIHIERFVDGDHIVKKIHCQSGEGLYEERVRLYSLPDLEPILKKLHLTVFKIFGDEHGADYDAKSSLRMSLLLRND